MPQYAKSPWHQLRCEALIMITADNIIETMTLRLMFKSSVIITPGSLFYIEKFIEEKIEQDLHLEKIISLTQKKFKHILNQ